MSLWECRLESGTIQIEINVQWNLYLVTIESKAFQKGGSLIQVKFDVERSNCITFDLH